MVIPRSWKDADAAECARNFLARRAPRRAAIRELMKELVGDAPYARRCAADLARRVSAREPGVLCHYADVLIDLHAECPREQWQSRGYLALAAALNATTHLQRERLEPLIRMLLEDERVALRAIAMEAFAILAVAEPGLRDEALLLVERSRHDANAAIRARGRRMLPALRMAEVRTAEAATALRVGLELSKTGAARRTVASQGVPRPFSLMRKEMR